MGTHYPHRRGDVEVKVYTAEDYTNLKTEVQLHWKNRPRLSNDPEETELRDYDETLYDWLLDLENIVREVL